MDNLLDTIKQRLRIWLSNPETENTFYVGTTAVAKDRDWPDYYLTTMVEF